MATSSPLRTFAAIAYNEVLLNSKRIAPYFMALLCAGNGLLWWGWGPLVGRGVAVNSDFAIAGVLPPYSFLFLPLFTALFMADPVSRDFRLGVDPLIFSKPISRAEYLLGKFFGNFFVLACCQSAFVVTWFALQAISKQGVTTQHAKVFPYIKHFLVLVVISHLGLAAFYFAVGVLTRNAKIVYGLGVAFYPVYITYQTVLLSSLPWRWKLALDPLAMNRGNVHVPRSSAEFVNQLVVTYDPDLIINRMVMILITAICLTIVYVRFSTTARPARVEKFSLLNLSTAAERINYPESSRATLLDEFERADLKAVAMTSRVAVPEVVRVNEGIRANLDKLIAALGVEFRLLRAERSLVMVMPLAIFLSILEVAFYNVPPDVSHSAAYATNTAKLLMLFLIGIAVFYTGEAMHRDREIRIQSMLWVSPASNNVLLLSKFLTTLFLLAGLIVVVGIAGVTIQVFRSHTPVDVLAYLRVYGIVVLPGAVFVTAVSLLLIVILRNKYLFYVVSVGAAVGLFYLYNLGYNHWLYNPMMYRRWTYVNLVHPDNVRSLILHRAFALVTAIFFIVLAHLLFVRKAGRSRSG